MSQPKRIIGCYDGPDRPFTSYHGPYAPRETRSGQSEPAPASPTFVPYQVYKDNLRRYSPPRQPSPEASNQRIEEMLEHILSEQKRHQNELDARLTNLKDDISAKVEGLAAKVRNMDDQITHIESMVVSNTIDLREKSKDIHAIKFTAKAEVGALEYQLKATNGRLNVLGEQIENMESRERSDSDEIKEGIDKGLDCVYKELMGNARAINTLEVKLIETSSEMHERVDHIGKALQGFNDREDAIKEVLNTNAETLESFVSLFAVGQDTAVPLTILRIEEEMADTNRSSAEDSIDRQEAYSVQIGEGNPGVRKTYQVNMPCWIPEGTQHDLQTADDDRSSFGAPVDRMYADAAQVEAKNLEANDAVHINMIDWMPEEEDAANSEDESLGSESPIRAGVGELTDAQMKYFVSKVRKIPPRVTFNEAMKMHPLDEYLERWPLTDVRELFLKVRRESKPTLRMVFKKGDPGRYTIPITINAKEFPNALCDTGACMSMMSRKDAYSLGI